jgi:hypothetical protein
LFLLADHSRPAYRRISLPLRRAGHRASRKAVLRRDVTCDLSLAHLSNAYNAVTVAFLYQKPTPVFLVLEESSCGGIAVSKAMTSSAFALIAIRNDTHSVLF